MSDSFDRALEGLAAAAGREASLELLLLFSSRARGDSHSRSDWDLGFLAGPGFDVDGFLATAVLLLGSDRVDLVDLAHASGLLRFRAAGEGRVLFQAELPCEKMGEETPEMGETMPCLGEGSPKLGGELPYLGHCPSLNFPSGTAPASGPRQGRGAGLPGPRHPTPAK